MKRKASIYLLGIILLILVSLSLAHVHSVKAMNAEPINVPDEYSTIQAAVDAAIAGDTIWVASGTYYENVVINKSLTLKGVSSDITIIDGGGRGTGVKITADKVNVSGFTIRNSGDGVHLYMCNGVNVSGNKITLNKNDGIYVQSSIGNNIGGNTITSNNLSGLFIQDSSGNTIIDNVIASNAHESVYLYDSSNNSVSGNTITSHVNWPAISLEGSNNNTIMGNTIINSEYVSVELDLSGGNIFYHNNFISNTDQVYPSGANAWDNGVDGNYWSDYNGTGLYYIDATNKDNHPLINPYDETKPVADAGPDQLVVEEATVTLDGSGSTDNLDIVNYGIVNYTWSFTDNTTIFLTGLKVNYTFDNSGNFSVALNVSDFSGNWGTDEMWVNVTVIEVTRDVAITNITVFPPTVTTGEPIFINVTVANEGDMNETFGVTVYYDSSVVGTKNVPSLGSGSNETLIFNWDTTGVPGGEYTVKAVANIVPGEINITDNTRIYGAVTIEKLVSTISIFAYPANMTVGSNITISGTISPVQASVNVTIQYRSNGGTWVLFAIVTTDSEGNYSYDWTTTEPGSYEFKASWEGNDNTLAAESDVWTATVKEPATNIYLYAAMAIAVVIAVSATLVYIVKIRKPKPARTQKLDLNIYS